MDYVITVENNPEVFKDVGFKDGATEYTIDFSPWSEKYGNITTATWTLKAGSASISGETLVSNVATALITFSQAGGSLIQVKGSTGSEIFIAHIDIMAKDPYRSVSDYGLCA